MVDDNVIIGIDLGGTKIAAALVEREGTCGKTLVLSAPFDKGVDAIAETIVTMINELRSDADQYVAGVGIAASGRVDTSTGDIIGGVPLCEGYIGFEMGQAIRSRVNLPVWLDNDANAAAFAEYKIGAGRNAKRLVCITIGTGIGGGIVIDGKLIRGNGNAGEIGHMVIDPEGPPCGCGRRGCLEQFVSRKRLAEELAEAIRAGKIRTDITPDDISTEEIIKLVKGGNSVAREIFDRQMHYLALAIDNLVNIIDPDVIVISGQISKLGGELLNTLREKMNFDVPLKTSTLGNTAGLIGAALLGYGEI
jgi:glucokinase